MTWTSLFKKVFPKRQGESSGDPMRIWWVDHQTKEKKLLKGPEKGINFAEAPISPDNRFVGFGQWQIKAKGKGRKEFLYTLERETGKIIDLTAE